jgi:hypothetical protein
MTELATSIFHMLLGIIIGGALTAAFALWRSKQITRFFNRAYLADDAPREWLEKNCSEREMQAVSYLILMPHNLNHSDLAILRKVAERAPEDIAKAIEKAAEQMRGEA